VHWCRSTAAGDEVDELVIAQDASVLGEVPEVDRGFGYAQLQPHHESWQLMVDSVSDMVLLRP
jgi:hypothetical protein